MNSTIAGWLKVIGAGASGAGGVFIAAPLNAVTVVVAICTFLAGMGTAAAAFLQPAPSQRDTSGNDPK